MIGMWFVYEVVVVVKEKVTTKSNVIIFTQSHIIVSQVLPSSRLLQELSHMDKITQGEIQYYFLSTRKLQALNEQWSPSASRIS